MAQFRGTGSNKGLELNNGDRIRFLEYPSIYITEISTDDTLSSDSDHALVSEKAIKKYVDDSISTNLTDPPAEPEAGDSFFSIVTGMPYFWDSTREMWLSSRFPLSFSYTGNCANQYLNAPNGYANPDGAYRVLRNLHIMAVIIDIRFTASGTNVTINPHLNKVTTGDDFDISGGGGWQFYENYTLDIDIPEQDKLQVWCTSNKSLNDAYVTFESAWRYIPS